MTANDLLAPPSPVPLPAPLWMLYVVKVLGFVLHSVPMHLWYVGLPVAVLRFGRDDGWSADFLRQLPFFMAFGINAGIVPLLFTQVVYHHVYFPATILMAWAWLSVIPVLMASYAGIYAVRSAVEHGNRRRVFWFGMASWLGLAWIGFLFANTFSLMVRPDLWPELARATGIAGAVRGMALNLSDPALWPRWLMTPSLAMMTLAWHPLLCAVMAGRPVQPNDVRLSFALGSLGALSFACVGLWYVAGGWPQFVREQMFSGVELVLTLATALSPALPLAVLAWLWFQRQASRRLVWIGAAGQLAVITLNAIARQRVQHLELVHRAALREEAVSLEWLPLAAFLIALAVGVAMIGYVVRLFMRRLRATVQS